MLANLVDPQPRHSDEPLDLWLALLTGSLDKESHEHLRRAATRDEQLKRDLDSIEQLQADGTFSTASANQVVAEVLQAEAYFAADTSGGGFTDAVVKDAASAKPCLRPAVFLLLEELGIELAEQESALASWLLEYMAGPQAVNRFRQMEKQVHNAYRQARSASAPALYRYLRTICRTLFAGPRLPRLSFRLFLRARLADYCREQGWKPREGTLHDAVNRLTRERISTLLDLAEEAEEHEGLQLARAQA